jgi:transposase-like protein
MITCAVIYEGPYTFRIKLVQYAHQHGLSAAARAFATTHPTERTWRRQLQTPYAILPPAQGPGARAGVCHAHGRTPQAHGAL